MKSRSLIKWSISIIIVLVFAVSFFLVLRDQSVEYYPALEKPSLTSQLTMKLKDVMDLEWDKDVTTIPNVFPGGRLSQFKSDGREMNVYMVNALLIDTDSNAEVSFQRNENKSGQLVTHRWVKMEAKSTEEIDRKYEKIINKLHLYGMKIVNRGKSNYADSRYRLEDSDGSVGYQLDFRKDLKTTALRIDITRYNIITEN